MQGCILSNPRFIMLTTIFLCLTVGSLPLFSSPCKQALGGAGSVDHYLYAFRGVLYVCKKRAVESPARMSALQVRVAPLSSRRFRAFFGVTLAFSLHCSSFKTAMLAVRPHLPAWWNMQDRKGSTLFDGAFFCSASALHGLKSAPIDPFSTARTGSSFRVGTE